jgi:hypothetical protein
VVPDGDRGWAWLRVGGWKKKVSGVGEVDMGEGKWHGRDPWRVCGDGGLEGWRVEGLVVCLDCVYEEARI